MKKALLFILLCCNCCVGVFNLTAQDRKPNIVILLSDDQGWGDLGFTGNKTVATPHIDRLFSEGVRFNRFYVNAVCSPTRAELLTGRSHVRGGVSGTASGKERLDLDETTFAQALKQAGYATGIFGKWHNGGQGPYHPNARGFDEFYGFTIGHIGNYFDAALQSNGKPVKGNGYITDDLTSKGLEFIEEHKSVPFLAYFPFNVPHSPMQVPDKNWDTYAKKEILQTGTRSELENIQHTRAALAMMENLDFNVGRILNKLSDLGLDSNTIIIYFSDNGPNGHRWNGNMKGIKGTVDEGGVRSPFVIRWNKKLQSHSIDAIASVMDIYPTLMDLIGASSINSKPLDGKSLVPLIHQKHSRELEERFLINYWSGKTSVRYKNLRLTHDGKLVDVFSDPSHSNDLSSTYVSEKESMLNFRDTWIRSVLTELPPQDIRPFVVGSSLLKTDILPSSEANGYGAVVRSNKHPNDSYFRQWRSDNDRIIWSVQVEKAGAFAVQVYYACSTANIGSRILLKSNNAQVASLIKTENSSPLMGREMDRVEREESYLRNFKSLSLGRLKLTEGANQLELYTQGIKKSDDLEIYMITLQRL